MTISDMPPSPPLMPGRTRVLRCPMPRTMAVRLGHGRHLGSGIGGMDTIVNTVVPMVNDGKVKRMGSTLSNRS